MTIEQDPNGFDPHAPGAKLDAGKIRAGLLMQFPRALGAIASIATYGADKYSEGGWQSVPDGIKRYTDAMFRHLIKHAEGEVFDLESGFPHLWHALWNLTAVVELTEREFQYSGSVGVQEPGPIRCTDESSANSHPDIYDFGGSCAQTYVGICECGERIMVSAQENAAPEYEADVYVKCRCGKSVHFNLPVN